uniref:Uncharacterized protein n=1 Tax=Anthurium amnicola TaxID=1678845 RepID=A0A1D1XWF3_9ARAE
MAAAASAASLSPPHPPLAPPLCLVAASRPRRPPPAVLPCPAAAAFAPFSRSRRRSLPPTPTAGIPPRSSRLWASAAAPGDAVPAEAIVDKAQEVVPAAAGDGAAPTIVSALLLVAFVGLSILTVGVIYIAVTDFLQKRERDKFEKEEATKKEKRGKKAKAKARAGPRGFGQKVVQGDDDEE